MGAPPQGRRPLRDAGDLLTTRRVHAVIDGLSVGGAELLLTELAAVAPTARIDLSVSYLSTTGGEAGAEPLRALGIEPVSVGITSLSPRSLQDVRRTIAAARPDVVHTHLGYSDLLGTLAARSLRVPTVSTLHAMQWSSATRGEAVKEQLMTWARRHGAARVIAVSDVARDRYLAEGRDRPGHVVVIRNGIRGRREHGAGERVRAELGLPADAIVLTMISVLRPEKAHDIAIEAVRRLRADDPRVRLLVVGAGELWEDVRRMSEDLGDGVVLAGFRSDPMAVLDATDVLLHPSRFDALPTTLIEAAAAAVPVVATRVGGIPEIVVEGETGVLVEAPPRPEALVAALHPLVDDPARRRALGDAARTRFEAEFSAETWVGRLRALYDEVVAGR